MLQKIYELNGVGETSLKLNLENNAKVNVLFQAIYGKDGTKAVSDEELLDKIEQVRSQDPVHSPLQGGQHRHRPAGGQARHSERTGRELSGPGPGWGKDPRPDPGGGKTDCGKPGRCPHSHEDETIHDALVSKENSNFPKEFVEAIFQKELNEPFLVETAEYLFVATRLSVRDEKMLESLRNTACSA